MRYTHMTHSKDAAIAIAATAVATTTTTSPPQTQQKKQQQTNNVNRHKQTIYSTLHTNISLLNILMWFGVLNQM